MQSTSPVVLVTGAARRIGASIARHLHACGYAIVLHYHQSATDAQQLAQELNQQRPESAFAYAADLAQFDRIAELVAHAIGHFGRLDALINNASGFYPTPFGSVTPTQWDALFASNLKAPFFLSQSAAPHLKQRRGCIINITDIYAEHALAQHSVYSMTKAGLRMMTQSLARELAPDIRVNAIAPGAILWPEQTPDATYQETVTAQIPLGHPGAPADIAETVRWLLQDAHYITGQTIHVDGGRLMNL